MSLSPDELARLYAGYEREELEQAVALGPVEYTRDAWIALCAECEKRGIAWNVPVAAPAVKAAATRAAHSRSVPAADGDAPKRCREAAMVCGIAVGLLACFAGYFIVDDWHTVSREFQMFLLLVLIFAFLVLVVIKIYQGSAIALWTMGIIVALILWAIFVDLSYRLASGGQILDLLVLVPVAMEITIVRAIMALRRKAKLLRA